MGLNITEEAPMESRQSSEDKLLEYAVNVLALLERHDAMDLAVVLGLTDVDAS